MNHHYFITAHDEWVCDEDLYLGLKRLWNRSKADRCSVYKVPLPDEGFSYQIENFVPQVEGCTFVDQCYRTVGKRKQGEQAGDLKRLQRTHDKLAALAS